MARTSLSGFPEWLPEGRIIEQFVLDHIRQVFELHGFSGIETRAVETLEQLEAKGETSKEVYVLDRLQAMKDVEAGRHSSKERKMGLHFDLTVPFARYVIENANELDFPFKRYQIQKVWRGERPQEGRFREFTQADIDVVGNGDLPFHFEVDLPLVMAEALATLPIPTVHVLVNNRKVVQGVCESLGVTDVEAALRGLDKLDKIGPEGVTAELAQSNINGEQAEKLLKMAQIRSNDPDEIRSRIAELGCDGELLAEGVDQLCALLEEAHRRMPGAVIADLKIARGLDYYTGSVYESVIEGHEDLGSICSGGRYDSLAKDGKRTYPGVGLSIGVSRLVSRMISAPMVQATRKVPAAVVVAVIDEADRARSEDIAMQLRSRGISTDVAPNAAKFGKQIKFADKRGIPFVWFPGMEDEADTVKDIRSGEQIEADASTWTPPAKDLNPRVISVGA
ncbi:MULTISPECIES: histidine--tRNA ligase [Actinomycetaceae]|uniref:Histidine--tRNA ligase n=1 Tax=Schaalia turicensis TaxID=131111 RepID=A0A2I1I643_9ACTO|nr:MULTISPECIES: histidine--tRNA ligase [Actinomycetaceae]MDK6400553.1 histidine--tRNA ligase [Pauljensenia sp. UMB9872]MDK7172998.1 histidine--tRNA ligase [Pauljensenia sp. UMB1235]PKY66569.1 histidine--tRNA ligase [Schaalia turicensis]